MLCNFQVTAIPQIERSEPKSVAATPLTERFTVLVDIVGKTRNGDAVFADSRSLKNAVMYGFRNELLDVKFSTNFRQC